MDGGGSVMPGRTKLRKFARDLGANCWRRTLEKGGADLEARAVRSARIAFSGDQTAHVARELARAHLAHCGELPPPESRPNVSRTRAQCCDAARTAARRAVVHVVRDVKDRPPEYWANIQRAVLSLADATVLGAFSDAEWRAHRRDIRRSARVAAAHQFNHELEAR